MNEIKKELDNIRDSCDQLEEKIEPKKARTRGDPVVELN